MLIAFRCNFIFSFPVFYREFYVGFFVLFGQEEFFEKDIFMFNLHSVSFRYYGVIIVWSPVGRPL